MKDPNLRKIIETNILEIQKNNLGTAITQASSYLDYIYKYKNRDKRKIELNNFVEEVKLLSNKLRIKNDSNGAYDVKSKEKQKNNSRKNTKHL